MTPARPGLRPMRALPMLEARREALEKCVFCPKLCRSACPVSNAEPRETITPWGKMTLAWMAAHGDVPIDASHGAPAWACTGCRACRESCDHRNEVADVLLDARSSLLGGGAAPAAALRVRQRFAAHEERTRAAARRIARHPSVRVGSPDVLLVGCGYLRAARAEATAGVDAAAALAGGPVSIFDGCCGLPLRLAGDRDAFARHARAVSDALRGRERLVVIDAGCALALRRAYGDVGVALRTRVELLVDLAARSLSSLAPIGDGGGLV
ncbi:MAG TPA: (Fe-S)-binding protein, partial [Polyangiaceae bacterium]|nr:(Fe-S)-binding protein [Polyangiaceae bacterium]